MIRTLAQEIREALEDGYDIQTVVRLLQEAEKALTIQSAKIDELTDDSIFLNCLRNNGVDNWDWYGEAVEEYQRIMGEGE